MCELFTVVKNKHELQTAKFAKFPQIPVVRSKALESAVLRFVVLKALSRPSFRNLCLGFGKHSRSQVVLPIDLRHLDICHFETHLSIWAAGSQEEENAHEEMKIDLPEMWYTSTVSSIGTFSDWKGAEGRRMQLLVRASRAFSDSEKERNSSVKRLHYIDSTLWEQRL